DPALLARALTACGAVAGYFDREVARSYFAEAIGLTRAIGDRWRLSQILALHAQGATIAGEPLAARAAATRSRRCDRRPVQLASVPLLARVGAGGTRRFGRSCQTIGRPGGRGRGGSR